MGRRRQSETDDRRGGSETPEQVASESRTDRLRIRAAWMYFVEQMTQNEIADVLGVGRVTIVRMLADARSRNEVSSSGSRDPAGFSCSILVAMVIDSRS